MNEESFLNRMPSMENINRGPADIRWRRWALNEIAYAQSKLREAQAKVAELERKLDAASLH